MQVNFAFIRNLKFMLEQSFLAAVQSLRARAHQHIGESTSKTGYSAHRESVLKLLNNALATEIVCVERYRRYEDMEIPAEGCGMADEFTRHLGQDQAHADQLADRIVQLGGDPDFSADGLASGRDRQSVKIYSLLDLIKGDMIAECITIKGYRDIVQFLGDRDPVSRNLMSEILTAEEQHAAEVARLLEAMPA